MTGCYLPDGEPYAFQADTRKELADWVRYELEAHDMPKSKFAEARISRLWSFIKRHGSSTAHFSFDHAGYTLSFHGLTEAEYEAACENNI
jgi:hypothetical protein